MPAGNLDLRCPNCQAQFQIVPEYFGRQVKCGSCGKRFQVPPPAPPLREPPLSARQPTESEILSDDLSKIVTISDGSRFRKIVGRRFQPATSWLDFFDWKFEKYLTPWIVRVTWILCLALAVIAISLVLIAVVASWAPETNMKLPEGRPRIFELQSPSLPRWLSSRVASTVSGFMLVFSALLTLLWIRVILEMAIVFFNVATTLATIEKRIERVETKS